LRDQVLAVRNVDGRLHVARKPRYDEWDPPIEPQDSYAQSPAATDEVVEAQHVSFGNTFHDHV